MSAGDSVMLSTRIAIGRKCVVRPQKGTMHQLAWDRRHRYFVALAFVCAFTIAACTTTNGAATISAHEDGGGGNAGSPAIAAASGAAGRAVQDPPMPGQSGASNAPPAASIDAAAPSEAGADSGGVPIGDQGCKGALFCETFEETAAGMPPNPDIWTRTSSDLVVDATDAALGSKKALHVPAVVNGFKYIREKASIAAMGTSFYGRVYFRIDRRPLEQPNGLFHWTVLSADEFDDYSTGKLVRIGGHIEADLTNWLRFNLQTHGNPGETGLDDRTMILG
ncbi:MAG TPA: hypothetical protein VNW92_01930, partial [Polyangiaceae bacterium]|nr:hypothetical protein [Polyangiaceae bacterium]